MPRAWLAALGVLIIGMLLWLAWSVTRSTEPPSAATLDQPAIGTSMVVTAPVWDGERYVTVPVAVGAERVQPAIGTSMVVTAPVWDGTTYRTEPVEVARR